MKEVILDKILLIPAILIAFTFHEYAHAAMADRLGDKTPKFQGRLTLNPLVHIDPIGLIMIMLAGFGWAKPVETNPRAYKRFYQDDLKVSIAGPLANFTVAVVFAVIVGIFYRFFFQSIRESQILYILYGILIKVVSLNVVLMIFNILPLPGLDGFHVFRDLFPSKFYRVADQLYRYQMFILIIFVATPIANYIIGIPAQKVTGWLFMISDFIARM